MIAVSIVSSLGLFGLLTLSLLLWRAYSQTMRVRDLLDGEQKLSAQYQSERDVAVVRAAVLEKELAAETELRKAAELQRNRAYVEARDFFVERIKQANLADAAKLVSDLLASSPWLQAVPKADDTRTNDTDLETP